MKSVTRTAFVLPIIALLFSAAFSQTKPGPKDIIFAVLDDGKTIEPISFIKNGAPSDAKTAGYEEMDLQQFAKKFFAAKMTYNVIFGGEDNGKLTVKAANYGECSGNSAEVTTALSKGKLGGFVMALATNAEHKAIEGAVRRRPTAAERAEIEKLVRAAFLKGSKGVKTIGRLRYHNFTAIDVDGDGNAELVGSYWFKPKADSRDLLFFIAEKNADGKYAFSYSEFRHFSPEEIMSGEAEPLDTGVYHELLLDYFDIDGDGTGEIFTTVQAFEGRNFLIYKKTDGKWTQIHESYNYRCGY
jgi:hypothetical protein